ncbi:hypothetical protein B9Z42_12310 [Limnohabitans sp. B9-3]|nr:hypothetical protein B9Z42_12310 [Limnohabitans sp. B9-3]
MQRDEVNVIGSENIKQKNYIIGQKISVTVGEPMIKFQDYWTTTSEKSVATVNKLVHIKGGPIDITLVPGKQYSVVGNVVQENVKYMLVRSDAGNLVMVKPDGTLRDRVGGQVNNNDVVTVVWTMTISDSSAVVTKEKALEINSSKGYENFELLYTGLSAGSMNVTYREFSPDGLARVAFFQNLTYPVAAKTVSFKKYKLDIQSATAENIVFTVLEDGR